MRPLLGSAHRLAQVVCRHPEDQSSPEQQVQIPNAQASRRQVHPVGARRERNIRTAVDENPAPSATRQREGLSSQLVQLPVGKVLFSYLDEIGAPAYGAADAGKERHPLQLPAVGDIAGNWTPIRKGCFDRSS